MYLLYLLLFNTLCTSSIDPITPKVYQALFGENINDINAILIQLESEESNTLHKAYYATLKMKKASFIKLPIEKLKTFKKACLELEAIIQSKPEEPEYRFLRCTIQENAPPILKYNKNIEEDCKLIKKNLSKFKSEVISFVRDYAKQSKYLKL